jgi:hypothetical protein
MPNEPAPNEPMPNEPTPNEPAPSEPTPSEPTAREPTAREEPRMRLGPFVLRASEARREGQPPIDQWQGPLQFALWCQRASPWWIGDLINAGEDLFGEAFGQVCGETLSIDMVDRYAAVARRVPPQNRRPALSWSAHAAVASLPWDEQRRVLAEAELNGWGSEEVRKAVSRRSRRS